METINNCKNNHIGRTFREAAWAGVLLVSLIGSNVQARDFRPAMLPQPDGDRFNCATCHFSASGGGARNAFGNDVMRFVSPGGRQNFWSSVFDLDSDGDGFTNGQELGDADGDGSQDPGVTREDITHPGNSNDFPEPPVPELVEVTVTLDNLAPNNGNFLTPLWVGFHDGSFDLFDEGAAASAGLESLAEDGVADGINGQFESSGASAVQGLLNALPVEPGARTSLSLEVDPSVGRYFSYASMVIPSNDAFIGNDEPLAHEIFDAEGTFLGASILISGAMIRDAGTEVNDEIPENTAFLEQSSPNTGDSENGTVQFHGGYSPGGTILGNSEYANADFTRAGYWAAQITVSMVAAPPASFRTISIDGIQFAGGQASIEWSGGPGPFLVQRKGRLDDLVWSDALETMESSATVDLNGERGFFRVLDLNAGETSALSSFSGGDGRTESR